MKREVTKTRGSNATMKGVNYGWLYGSSDDVILAQNRRGANPGMIGRKFIGGADKDHQRLPAYLRYLNFENISSFERIPYTTRLILYIHSKTKFIAEYHGYNSEPGEDTGVRAKEGRLSIDNL